MNSVWTITSYYNPAHYKRRYKNFLKFRSALKTPLVVVEHAIDGQFQLTRSDADILVQLDGGSPLWQKERLLNIALDHVPSSAEIIAWIDCDVIFDDKSWSEKAIKLLKTHAVIQLFSELVDLPAESDHLDIGELNYIGVPSLTKLVADGITPQSALRQSLVQPISRISNPGTAWAARREFIQHCRFYDAMVMGSGDSAMAHAAFGELNLFIEKTRITGEWKQSFLSWAEMFNAAVRRQIGMRSGRIFHLWHGEIRNRLYTKRHEILQSVDFSPERHLELAPSGAWKLKDINSDFAEKFEAYFRSRQEDG